MVYDPQLSIDSCANFPSGMAPHKIRNDVYALRSICGLTTLSSRWQVQSRLYIKPNDKKQVTAISLKVLVEERYGCKREPGKFNVYKVFINATLPVVGLL